VSTNPWRYITTIQVTATLGDRADDFDIDAIVTALIERYGYIDVGEIPSREYWDIVLTHDKRRPISQP
jgi:hypothetical protein